jgi:hypothetical protein
MNVSSSTWAMLSHIARKGIKRAAIRFDYFETLTGSWSGPPVVRMPD